jgi:micrococcal nuclease
MRLILAAALLALPLPSQAYGPGKGAIGICRAGHRAARHVTWVYDGDTRWENGVKWRLLDVDAPEISDAACPRELELARRSRDRLITLMRHGHVIRWSGKADGKGKRSQRLVDIVLPDGRDVASILIQERLAQPWPNSGNVWCDAR